MTIEKVSIVGMGSLGLIFGSFLMDKLGRENVEFVMDEKRLKRYSGVERHINGKKYDFKLVSENEKDSPADLIIFAVKSTGLEDAVEIVRNKVSDDTIIISLLNGITSEEIIGEALGKEKVIYTIAEGMDPIRTGHNLDYTKMGQVRIGIDKEIEEKKERLETVLEMFDRTGFPYKLEEDVMRRLWSKFMLNVGVNQVLMIYEGNYDTIQKPGPARDLMIDAMKEVITLAEKENIKITEADIDYYVSLIDSLNPEGMPSMRYDGIHKIKSEVEIFAGTVLKYGKKHGVPTPINQDIYDRIKEIESKY
ncbi:ketopantoate reductase family protein [Gudongella sp. DL1XJH-153]|uniref:ketopantoate reductase family protein n=1 Tax=Gudongella sp. DL1XJH-153 TaxID=3409804 RepID=UPI003BB4A031